MPVESRIWEEETPTDKVFMNKINPSNTPRNTKK
jgi:hypothetical protein